MLMQSARMMMVAGVLLGLSGMALGARGDHDDHDRTARVRGGREMRREGSDRIVRNARSHRTADRRHAMHDSDREGRGRADRDDRRHDDRSRLVVGHRGGSPVVHTRVDSDRRRIVYGVRGGHRSSVVITRVDHGNRRIVHSVRRGSHHSPVVVHRPGSVVVVPGHGRVVTRHSGYGGHGGHSEHYSRRRGTHHGGYSHGGYYGGHFGHGGFVWHSGGCRSSGGITIRIPF